MITTMKKLKSGYINGTRVSLGNLNDFLTTSCITNLSFLGSAEDGRPDILNPQVLTQFLNQNLGQALQLPFPVPGSKVLGRAPDARLSSSFRASRSSCSAQW